MKQVYKLTYPTGKIYIGSDKVGSYRYFGSPQIKVINEDFKRLPKKILRDYSVRKQILWESETATDKEMKKKEVELILKHKSNNPEIGYNRWPKYQKK